MPDVHAWLSDGKLMVFAVIFFVAFHYVIQKIGSKAGTWIHQASAQVFPQFVAKRERRKTIKAMQAERKRRGLPPLENPLL
jgi:hypothetical protein